MTENKLTRNKPTDFQVLSDLFAGTVEEHDLTDHQQEKLKRLKTIQGMLLDMKPINNIIRVMKSVYGLSESQIIRDIRLTEKLYGDARGANKSFDKMLARNMALETYRIAKANDDLRGMASANKNFIEATGCNIDDPDLPEWEKLVPSPNIIIIPESIMQKMAEKLNAGPVRYQADESKGDTIEDHEELDNTSTRSH